MSPIITKVSGVKTSTAHIHTPATNVMEKNTTQHLSVGKTRVVHDSKNSYEIQIPHRLDQPLRQLHLQPLQPQQNNTTYIIIQTPVKVDRLAKLLVKFPLADYVVDGFTNGFHINFKGDHQPLTLHNAASATLNPEAVAKKIRSELEAGRIAGPFTEVPFKIFKSSALSLREKSTPGQFRLLHNLSYPYDGKSVNFNIPKQM